MITRFVKLTVKESEIDTFKNIFEENQNVIMSSEGCFHAELLQDVSNPCVFFTFSKWESVDHLNLYRQSEVFGEIWKRSKKTFSSSAEAWSLST